MPPRQIRERYPSALAASGGWRSHQTGVILRQARNLQSAGRSAEEVLKFVLTEFDTLAEECSQIIASWKEIEQFVADGDEDGYLAWAIECELDRQRRKGSTALKATDWFVADCRERFKRWLLEIKQP